MTVQYVTIDRPRRVAVKMTSRSKLFERFAGAWSFEPGAAGGTHVVFRYGFETRWRLLRPLLDRVIVARFTHDLRERLAALKRAVELPDRADVRPAAPEHHEGEVEEKQR
jgi:ribosome-associated toxin RatA of RatAB toxin-antitoxin module